VPCPATRASSCPRGSSRLPWCSACGTACAHVVPVVSDSCLLCVSLPFLAPRARTFSTRPAQGILIFCAVGLRALCCTLHRGGAYSSRLAPQHVRLHVLHLCCVCFLPAGSLVHVASPCKQHPHAFGLCTAHSSMWVSSLHRCGRRRACVFFSVTVSLLPSCPCVSDPSQGAMGPCPAPVSLLQRPRPSGAVASLGPCRASPSAFSGHDSHM